MNTGFRHTAYGIGLALMLALAAGQPAIADEDWQREARPSGAAMTLDALIARPLLAVATVGGSAVFVVSLPFTALGGGVGEAADTLIKTPAEATFRRCLGCKTSRRANER
ncbi:MAG: hypothetical protein L0I84_03840 [Halomonas subglaciescola]|nr:hypothetical protein [Halomonas subglaciescola]